MSFVREEQKEYEEFRKLFSEKNCPSCTTKYWTTNKDNPSECRKCRGKFNEWRKEYLKRMQQDRL